MKKILLASILLASLTTYAKEKEMTIHLHFANSRTFNNNWPVNIAAAKETGIRLRSVTPESATNSLETINLLMASGDLPDIVAGQNTREIFNRYGMEGAFIPLNKLIEKHAPNIKKLMEENPEVKNAMTAPDGNIYFIPYVPDGVTGKGWFIRKDWLDKLGLEVPKNVDDFYEVMKAFKEKDPDGNGKNDTVAFITRENAGWEVLRLANLFGARVSGSDRTFGDFYEDKGVVKHGFIEPQFRIGVENIAKWYKEGLIDPEIFTRGSKAREIMFGNNQAGITRDWFVSTLALNKVIGKKVEGFELISMDPPVDITGNQWEESRRSKVKPDGWAISYKNKNPEETIKYFDFFFSEKGKRLANFGVEGEHYDIVDGKPVFKPVVFESGKTPLDYLKGIGSQVPIGFPQDYEYEKATATSEVVNAMEDYAKFTKPGFPGVILNVQEKKVYDKVWPSLYPYMQERVQKWILGSEELNDKTWADYLSKVDSMGYKEIIKVMQSAYDRQNKK